MYSFSCSFTHTDIIQSLERPINLGARERETERICRCTCQQEKERERERERDGENGYKSKSDVSILNVDSAVTTKAGGHAATMPPCK
jgi:hypothetical protein